MNSVLNRGKIFSRSVNGFTMVELLVALAVLAILVSIGIPSFQNLISQNRTASAVNAFQLSLQLARSTAVSRNYPSGNFVTVCPSNDGQSCTGENWSVGWVVLDPVAPDPVLRVTEAPHPSITINSGQSEFRFTNTGTVASSGQVSFQGPGSSEWSQRVLEVFASGSTNLKDGVAE